MGTAAAQTYGLEVRLNGSIIVASQSITNEFDTIYGQCIITIPLTGNIPSSGNSPLSLYLRASGTLSFNTPTAITGVVPNYISMTIQQIA